MKSSAYFSAIKSRFKNEWMLSIDENDRVFDIKIGSEDDRYIMLGISYWNKYYGNYLVNKLEESIAKDNFKEIFWNDIVKDNINNINNINVKLEKLSSDYVYELDFLEELEVVRNSVEIMV